MISQIENTHDKVINHDKHQTCNIFQENNFTERNDTRHSRDCVENMPAVLLAANIIPALALKLVLPFIPFYVRYVPFFITSYCNSQNI